MTILAGKCLGQSGRGSKLGLTLQTGADTLSLLLLVLYYWSNIIGQILVLVVVPLFQTCNQDRNNATIEIIEQEEPLKLQCYNRQADSPSPDLGAGRAAFGAGM